MFDTTLSNCDDVLQEFFKQFFQTDGVISYHNQKTSNQGSTVHCQLYMCNILAKNTKKKVLCSDLNKSIAWAM